MAAPSRSRRRRRSIPVACMGFGVVTAALTGGWIGPMLLLVLIVVPVTALCWVLADHDRTSRLKQLVTAWRRP